MVNYLKLITYFLISFSSTGATTKGLHTNGLSLKKELKDDTFAHERGNVNGKYAVAKTDDFVEQAQMGCEQEFHMKLCSIFDKVLVVDSVAAARKVVRRLTKKYKHHVHACDTEAGFLQFLLIFLAVWFH